jgi:tripartite-type tricarboxylate transporter receptor subunit TctC
MKNGGNPQGDLRHQRDGAMTTPAIRKWNLALGLAGLVVPGLSQAQALDYPTRPVRFIVGYAPAGATDILARLIGQKLSERLGQQFVVENRPGAASNLATEAVVNAAPDGYTLLLVNPANAINATLYDRLNFNFLRDIAPVAALIRVPNVMEVNPALPVRSVPEFIAYAKANPGRINMASGGAGTSVHMSGELFKMMTGISMVHVPYRGAAPAVMDLIAGQVQVVFDNLPGSIEHIRAGKLRPLAMTTTQRAPALPDVPVVADFVPGYEASAWFGMGVPKGTPAEIVDKLNAEVNAAMTDPTIKARLADLGGILIPGTPADFGRLLAEETGKWATVVKFAGVKGE